MLAAQWRDCKLGDVLTLQRDFDLPKKNRRKGAVPIVSSSGVSGYHDTHKV
jgi:type I restriction enzyme, S subunit